MSTDSIMRFKYIFLSVAVLLSTAAMAQPRAEQRGYSANVGIYCGSSLNAAFSGEVDFYTTCRRSVDPEYSGPGLREIFALTTTHGWSDGKGLFVGGGIGVGADYLGLVTIPVFVQLKYGFMPEKSCSPFVGAKFGGMFSVDEFDTDNSLMIKPGIGLDFYRFTLELNYVLAFRGYESCYRPYEFDSIGTPAELRYNVGYLELGLYFNF